MNSETCLETQPTLASLAPCTQPTVPHSKHKSAQHSLTVLCCGRHSLKRHIHILWTYWVSWTTDCGVKSLPQPMHLLFNW